MERTLNMQDCLLNLERSGSKEDSFKQLKIMEVCTCSDYYNERLYVDGNFFHSRIFTSFSIMIEIIKSLLSLNSMTHF